jgi:hypothetical protein
LAAAMRPPRLRTIVPLNGCFADGVHATA